MSNEQNYRILGLQEGCTESEIKRAYIILAKKYHPDKAQKPSEGDEGDSRTFVGIHKAYSQITRDISHRREEKSRKFRNYMHYVNTIIGIFNDQDSEDSQEEIGEGYFQSQQESMERACQKIMKNLPHACKDSRQSAMEASRSKKRAAEQPPAEEIQKPTIQNSLEQPPALQQSMPEEQEIYRMVKRKKLIFKVHQQKR